MCECELRERALEMAIEWRGQNEGSTDNLIDIAKKFYDFMKCNECASERPHDFNIIISECAGVFTASSYKEPLFFFERPTLEEVTDVVKDTLSSYLKNF